MNTLRTLAHSHTPHGTVFLPHQRWNGGHSPYHLEHESGAKIPTQWDLVASLEDGDVVQITGVDEAQTSGSYELISMPSPRLGIHHYDKPTLYAVGLNTTVFLQVDDYPAQPIAGPESDFKRWHRSGPACLTFEYRNHLTEFLGVTAFWTVYAYSKTPELELLFWNRAGLRGYFDQIKILGATPTGQDPAISMSDNLLVRPDPGGKHVFPQRAVRPMRVKCWLDGNEDQVAASHGWGAFSWPDGYLPQSLTLPILRSKEIEAEREKATTYTDLFNRAEITDPGYDQPPPSHFWKTRGGYYRGFTGGIDREQISGIFAAASADEVFIKRLHAEEVEDFCRQPGIRFAENGDPETFTDLADEQGRLPFSIYSNRILKGEGQHNNWMDAQTGECPYEGELARFEPHDDQHGDRIWSQSQALVWLTGSPLSKVLLQAQMETWLLQMPFPTQAPEAATGTSYGRGEAWIANAVATVATWDPDTRLEFWSEKFTSHLSIAQLPTGLWSVKDFGKVATAEPFGHSLAEPCRTGLHSQTQSASQVADFRVGRSNENIALMHALRGFHKGPLRTASNIGSMIRRCGQGLADYAWLGAGVRDRYIVSELAGQPFTALSQMTPAAEQASAEFAEIYNGRGDSYFIGNALQYAVDEGAEVEDRVQDFAGGQDVLALLEGRRKHDIHNWGHLLGRRQLQVE